jgi:ABC-type lipoprotein release transport system permease subunit
MKNIFKLAWRNLWRNPRRTLIVMSSVFFSAFLCIIMMSMMDGSNNYILDAMIEQQIGHFQVMDTAYRNDKVVDNMMIVAPEQLKTWENTENVERIAPKIETYAMAWNGVRSKGLAFMGIDPKREAAFSKLNNRLVEGAYLSQDDDGVLVGKRCADVLRLKTGDTLTLIGQGYHGAGAAGLFVVKGIIEAFDPNLDAGIAYTSLTQMQEFLNIPDGISVVSVTLKNSKHLDETIAKFNPSVDGQNAQLGYYPWQDLIEGTMAGAIDNKRKMSTYFYFLYIIVGFGLLSTVIMLTNERHKEFGVMTAIGTKKSTIISSLIMEMLFVSFLGLLLCLILAIPLLAYYQAHPYQLSGDMAKTMTDFGADPILPMDLSVNLFATQFSIVLVMILFVCLYPMITISRMKVINALRD